MKRVLGLLLLLAVGLGVPETLEAARFSGRPLKMTAVTRDDEAVLGVGSQWKTVPGMFVDFTTTKTGPAVATLCGEVSVDIGDAVWVRVWQTGVGGGAWEPEALTLFVFGPLLPEARCFSWFATLPAGTYRIKAQWMAEHPDEARVQSRSFRVQHEN